MLTYEWGFVSTYWTLDNHQIEPSRIRAVPLDTASIGRSSQNCGQRARLARKTWASTYYATIWRIHEANDRQDRRDLQKFHRNIPLDALREFSQ